MRKSLLCKCLLLLVVLVLPKTGWAQKTVDGVVYELMSETVLRVNGFASGVSKTELVIPETVHMYNKDYPVTDIKDEAFMGNKTLQKVTYPKSLKHIGFYSFNGCTNLRSFHRSDNSEIDGLCSLQSTLTRIDHGAFYHCHGFTQVTLIEPMDYNQFMYDNQIFYECNGITTATIYGNVPPYFLTGCANLERCYLYGFPLIPNKAITIGDYAFDGCTNLKTISLANVEKIGDSAFHSTGLTDVTVTSKTVSVGSRAFYSCSNLKTVSLACASIGSSAFEYCNAMTDLTLQSGVTSIGFRAFRYCKAIEGDLNLPEGLTTLASEAFHSSTCKNLTLPSTLQTIGNKAFGTFQLKGCLTINSSILADGTVKMKNIFGGGGIFEELIIGSNIKRIKTGAFAGFDSYKMLTIDSPSLVIEDGAFPNTASLRQLNLNCYSVGNAAFAGCSILKQLTLQVQSSIGEGAFMNCNALEQTHIKKLPASVGAMKPCFQSCAGQVTIAPGAIADFGSEVPLFRSSAFSQATVSDYVTGLFVGCPNLSTIVFDNSTKVGSNIAWDCPNLKSFDVAGNADQYVVQDGCIYKRVALGLELLAVPQGLRVLVPDASTVTVGGIDHFPGVVDLRGLTRFPSLSMSEGVTDYPCVIIPASSVAQYSSNTQWKRLGSRLIGKNKGDANGDGKLTKADVYQMQQILLNK